MTDKTSGGSPSERCFDFTSLPAIWKYAVPSEKSTRCWYAPRCCSAVGCADHGVRTLWEWDSSLFSRLRSNCPEERFEKPGVRALHPRLDTPASMRALLLTIVLVGAAAAAQLPAAPSIAVVDENGVAVPSARITLQSSSQPAVHCLTIFTGRCQIPSLPSGEYQLHVEKEGYYALDQPRVQIDPGSTIEVTLNHQQEVREIVDVRESTPAIDPTQVSSRETLTGLDVLNIVFPATHDYRNALNFSPGVVQDQYGQTHIAGAQTYQTQTLLDGFNVTQPANGQLLIRVSIDAFRSIQVEPSREPAEAGKGSAGLLMLNTGIGDDHFRFWATDFIPSVINRHGWRFNQFLPRFTFSGPIEKGKIWFYNAFDGEYDNQIYTELPRGADNDQILRIGNLTKLQANVTNRNILT